MPRVVIIGNSIAGFFLCKTLLEKSTFGLEIIVVDKEKSLPHRKDLLIDFLLDNINQRDLFLCTEDFYIQKKIKLLKGIEVTRVDTKKKRIFFKDESKLEYDYLVIATGRKTMTFDLPGKNKDGIFKLESFEDVKRIKERLFFSQTICLFGDPIHCSRLAVHWAGLGKDIKVIGASRCADFVEKDNIEWLDNLHPVEFIGEGSELKAIKLNNGKVIGISFALYIGPWIPATQFLKDSGILLEQGFVCVNDFGQTNVEGIFACGAVVSKNKQLFFNFKEAQENAILVGESLFIRLQNIQKGEGYAIRGHA